MDQLRLTFLVDVLLGVLLAAIAGLGFLMKYVLLPGREAAQAYGRQVTLTLLGLDRHAWGVLHLYLGCALLALVGVHIVLHWLMLPGLFARWVPDARRRRRLAWGYALLLALLLLLPFLVRPEIQESGPGSGRGGGRLRGMILGDL
ncbi:MAG: DUF4405 domain-containing protein [Syntrophobacterales bacterium]|nr:DUF4405 domain-containing protein [Syntrophobacterales bacterium]